MEALKRLDPRVQEFVSFHPMRHKVFYRGFGQQIQPSGIAENSRDPECVKEICWRHSCTETTPIRLRPTITIARTLSVSTPFTVAGGTDQMHHRFVSVEDIRGGLLCDKPVHLRACKKVQ